MDGSQPILSVLVGLADASNSHDSETITENSATGACLEMPRGREPGGQLCTGKAAVHEAFQGRFPGIPDMHCGNLGHCVGGDCGISTWLLSVTGPERTRVCVRGCDFCFFRDELIAEKDPDWKIDEKGNWARGAAPTSTISHSLKPLQQKISEGLGSIE